MPLPQFGSDLICKKTVVTIHGEFEGVAISCSEGLELPVLKQS